MFHNWYCSTGAGLPRGLRFDVLANADHTMIAGGPLDRPELVPNGGARLLADVPVIVGHASAEALQHSPAAP